MLKYWRCTSQWSTMLLLEKEVFCMLKRTFFWWFWGMETQNLFQKPANIASVSEYQCHLSTSHSHAFCFAECVAWAYVLFATQSLDCQTSDLSHRMHCLTTNQWEDWFLTLLLCCLQPGIALLFSPVDLFTDLELWFSTHSMWDPSHLPIIFKESVDKDQEMQTYSPYRSPHFCWNF